MVKLSFEARQNGYREVKTNQGGDWLMTRCEKTTERYIEAEEFIMNLKWWERIFISGKIDRFIKSRITKYNF